MAEPEAVDLPLDRRPANYIVEGSKDGLVDDLNRKLAQGALQALAIEMAEGAAEYLHRRIREDWGFPDAPTMTTQDRFTSRFRGKCYSFGYPACPNLEDPKGSFALLQPEL